MTNTTEQYAIAAVRFKFQKEGDGKTYDYLVPNGFILNAGDKVIVETKRGEATVTVVEIKDASEMAEKFILRVADPETEAAAPVKPADEWNF